MFVFSELMWEVVVRFVDIGGIVDHHSLNVFFINLNYLDVQPFDERYSRNVQSH